MLSSSCKKFLNKQISVQTNYGWGWQILANGACVSYQSAMTNGVTFSVVIKSFFGGIDFIRGFEGLIYTKNIALPEKIAAFTLSDNIYQEGFDFENNLCPAWRLIFGVYNLTIFPNGTATNMVEGTIFGYGLVTSTF